LAKRHSCQRTITNEFSLDNDTSCLSKLKRELTELLATSEKKNQLFQEEVKVSLAKIVTQREEAIEVLVMACGLRKPYAISSFANRSTRAMLRHLLETSPASSRIARWATV